MKRPIHLRTTHIFSHRHRLKVTLPGASPVDKTEIATNQKGIIYGASPCSLTHIYLDTKCRHEIRCIVNRVIAGTSAALCPGYQDRSTIASIQVISGSS